MYRLFCDSNCELPFSTVRQLGLNVIQMPYILDGEECFYDMGENTDLHAFFEKMRLGSSPKTAALNEYAYKEYFEPILAAGEDIYYIAFSHKMSGTFHSMQLAIDELKEKYPEREIRVKDTKLISMGSGFVTYYGALKYQEGATMSELDAYLDDLIAHTSVYFVVDDLTYLHRGGRVSGTAKVFGNLLGIKPILYMNEEGAIVNVDKVKGKRKALAKITEYLKEKGSELAKYKTFLVDADCRAETEVYAETLRKEFPEIDLVLGTVGPVIGSHCGPDTVGLVFHSKQK